MRLQQEPKINGSRLYQRLADLLATAIAQGEYPPGAKLPAERKLAEHYAVSRPTVREAIIALELSGLVEVRGGSGVYVCVEGLDRNIRRDLDLGAFDILEARIVVEGEAAELAAKRISDEELEGLTLALEAMVQENEREPGYEEADENFHLLIARATHNEALVSTIAHLWTLRNNSPISARILEKVRQAGSRPQIDEHRKILEALRGRDAPAAKAAMREHLTRVIQQLLNATEAEAVENARQQVASDRMRFGLGSE